MLNDELYLNKNMFSESVEKRATREGYGDELVALGGENNDIVVLTADLSESTKVDQFQEKYPDRFFECGIAEQSMVAVAAGFGVNGKRAFSSSYATFSPGKNWETIRTTVAYNDSDVKIAGHHAGLMTAQDGATHQALEDIALMRVLPNMRVLCPCDYYEAMRVTKVAGENYGPFYLRFTREATPIITTESTPFNLGENYSYWVSEKPQCVIFATGYTLYYALLAASILKKEGIELEVINLASIKPINKDFVISRVKNVGRVLTVEDHQVACGIGSLIAEILSQECPSFMEFVGMHDQFGESGTSKELISKYGIDEKGIIKSIYKLLKKQ